MSTSSLITEPNIPDPDGFYAELLALHDGRSVQDSQALNARLIMILANHIGDRAVLREAFALAEKAGHKPEAQEIAAEAS